MKFFCGLISAWISFALINTGLAQDIRAVRKTQIKGTWQEYDSLTAVSAFKGDTIGALENYRKSLELNPANEQLRRNYQKLSYQFARSAESFYNINP